MNCTCGASQFLYQLRLTEKEMGANTTVESQCKLLRSKCVGNIVDSYCAAIPKAM